MPLRADDPEPAVVEGDLVRVVDEAHVVGALGVGLGGDDLDVAGVAEHGLAERAEGELAELDGAGRRRGRLLLGLAAQRA